MEVLVQHQGTEAGRGRPMEFSPPRPSAPVQVPVSQTPASPHPLLTSHLCPPHLHPSTLRPFSLFTSIPLPSILFFSALLHPSILLPSVFPGLRFTHYHHLFSWAACEDFRPNKRLSTNRPADRVIQAHLWQRFTLSFVLYQCSCLENPRDGGA